MSVLKKRKSEFWPYNCCGILCELHWAEHVGLVFVYNSSEVSRCYAYKPYIYEFIRTMHEWMCKCGVSCKSDKRKKWHHENRKMFFTKKKKLVKKQQENGIKRSSFLFHSSLPSSLPLTPFLFSQLENNKPGKRGRKCEAKRINRAYK